MKTIISNIVIFCGAFVKQLNWANLLFFILFIPGCYFGTRWLAGTSRHNNLAIVEQKNDIPSWDIWHHIRSCSPKMEGIIEPFYYKVFNDIGTDVELIKLCDDLDIDNSNLTFYDLETLLEWLSVSGNGEKELQILSSGVINEQGYKQYPFIYDYLNETYYPRILSSLRNGDYYLAKAQLDRFFRIYSQGVEFPEFSKAMNKAFLLYIVLQDRWEVSSNRTISTLIIDRIIDEDKFKNQLSFNSDNDSFKYISDYFTGLDEIRDKDYNKAYDCFLKAMDETKYEYVKELCSLMLIRCAVWKYDLSHNLTDYTSAVKVIHHYSANVKQQYFKADLDGYIARLKKLKAEYMPL